MAQLTVRFDLSFGARTMRCLMVAAMIFAAAPELASESVTLTTYYPAPSGVYAQMITTGMTFLARDGGQVSIGGAGATPPTGTILGVAGNVNIGGTLTINTGMTPVPANIYLNVNGNANVMGTMQTSGSVSVAGGSNYVWAGNVIANASCSHINVTENATQSCNGYVTTISGMYAQYIALPYGYNGDNTHGSASSADAVPIDAYCCAFPQNFAAF